MKWRRGSAVSLLMTVMLVGCGGGSKVVLTPVTLSSITVTPQNSAVTVGGSVQFTAIANMSDGSQVDITSSAGWTSSDTRIGTVNAGNASGLKPGGVTLAVAQGLTTASTTLNVTALNLSNATLNGNYAFLLRGVDSLGPIFAAGIFAADGAGNITGGVVDVNTAAVGAAPPGTALGAGQYGVNADGRGTASFVIYGQSVSCRLVISLDGSKGKLIGSASGRAISGEFEKISAGAQLTGSYIFRLAGVQLTVPPATTSSPVPPAPVPLLYIGEIGTMTATPSAVTGSADENFNGDGVSYAAVTISASTTTSADSNNRGTLKLTLADGTPVNFAYYLVSPAKVFMISTDTDTNGTATDLLAGVAEAQTTTAASGLADGDYIFLLDHAASATAGTFENGGKLSLTSGVVTAGSMIEDVTTSGASGEQTIVTSGGTYMPAASSRGTISLTSAQGASRSFVVYAADAHKAYMLEIISNNNSTGASRAAVGEVENVTGSSMLPTTGNFILFQSELGESNLLQVGQLSSDGTGHLNGVVDFIGNAGQSSASFSSFPVNWTLAPVPGDPFQNQVNPANLPLIQNYVLYVRPDGNRTVIVGNLPDTDGYLDQQ